jgi:hypothetical protein
VKRASEEDRGRSARFRSALPYGHSMRGGPSDLINPARTWPAASSLPHAGRIAIAGGVNLFSER